MSLVEQNSSLAGQTALLPEHSVVQMRHPVPAFEVLPGTKGTIVHVYTEGKGYEVEFANAGGIPKLIDVALSDVEPVSPGE